MTGNSCSPGSVLGGSSGRASRIWTCCRCFTVAAASAATAPAIAGRLALFELLAIGNRLRRLTTARGDAALIKQTALEEGLRPMIVDGLSKVILGLTTPEEVLRATG
jgi:type II secretory ATPase GspE/PulE/Tfp pilus assembly ATPase PilB-like protein